MHESIKIVRGSVDKYGYLAVLYHAAV